MERLRSLEELIDALKRLPGVGSKSAERMAFALLNFQQEDLDDLATKISEIKKKIHPCPICGLYTENAVCSICSNLDRTDDLIIVVAKPNDIIGFEQLANFNGRYHVLGGLVGATSLTKISDLNIDSLIERINKEKTKEIIIATNPNIEGETTALYIAKLLEDIPVKVTRIGYGVSMGSQIDYVDSLTLHKSLESRKEIK